MMELRHKGSLRGFCRLARHTADTGLNLLNSTGRGTVFVATHSWRLLRDSLRFCRKMAPRLHQCISSKGCIRRRLLSFMSNPHRRLAVAFVAAVAVHAAVLFGIGAAPRAPKAPSLEVTLVEGPSEAPDPRTHRFAAQNQRAGSATKETNSPPGASAHSDYVSHNLSHETATIGKAPTKSTRPAPLSSLAHRGAHNDGASARNARKKLIAGYLAQWRAKVEQAGTSHYPTRALKHARRHELTVEVVINARGHIRSSRIVHGSGSRQLDRAALRILHMAAPFPPLPAKLRRHQHDLRFAYTWRFVGD